MNDVCRDVLPTMLSAKLMQAGEIGKYMYYTYVLVSDKDKRLYIGWTVDLKNRVAKHNSGLVASTRLRKPFKLIYYEACLNKKLAIKREKTLKTGYGRKFLKKRLNI